MCRGGGFDHDPDHGKNSVNSTPVFRMLFSGYYRKRTVPRLLRKVKGIRQQRGRLYAGEHRR